MKEIRVFWKTEEEESLSFLDLTNRKTYGGYGGTTMVDCYVNRKIRYRILENGSILRMEANPGDLYKKKMSAKGIPFYFEMIIEKKFISEGRIGNEFFGLERIKIIRGSRSLQLYTFEIESNVYSCEEVSNLLYTLHPNSRHEVLELGLYDYGMTRLS